MSCCVYMKAIFNQSQMIKPCDYLYFGVSAFLFLVFRFQLGVVANNIVKASFHSTSFAVTSTHSSFTEGKTLLARFKACPIDQMIRKQMFALCLPFLLSKPSVLFAVKTPYYVNCVSTMASQRKLECATFAGGCFWGMEKWFRKEFGNSLDFTAVGFIGGSVENTTYEKVCSGKTDHAEAIQVIFDTEKTQYVDLLKYFWRIHDATTLNRQGNDRGPQYRSAVFAHSSDQKLKAEQIRDEIQNQTKDKIVTEIVECPADSFIRAEEYHQQYLEKNPSGYCSHKPRY
ncbi:peptide methionine sulfoxide reductase [Cardiosporidium cionae]|uniref:peptide-methionine (S)-S-oxide reductase n=1 Tax=Cardiosporidium cionae TaxID=476202 RepID=A0ABQ7JBC9_9APIC|nr:peptide methionine sulfoxide reductase [Cardiosporidium cionae]|eukprot:KAF8820960.1 peptide methionine sulfoxide reductase [Cardiosporidium cionae]